jgi:hypothetical protein
MNNCKKIEMANMFPEYDNISEKMKSAWVRYGSFLE